MNRTEEEARRVLEEADRLYTEQEVSAALAVMAQGVASQLAGRNPVVLVVMTGGIIPAGQLLPRLDFSLQLDYVHVSRYRHELRGGDLQWVCRPRTNLEGRPVLLVDDILDEGVTLDAIAAECRVQGASEVLSAVLVNKRHERKVGLAKATFTGLKVADRYVFGSGMDYKGYHRNVAGIYAVRGV